MLNDKSKNEWSAKVKSIFTEAQKKFAEDIEQNLDLGSDVQDDPELAAPVDDVSVDPASAPVEEEEPTILMTASLLKSLLDYCSAPDEEENALEHPVNETHNNFGTNKIDAKLLSSLGFVQNKSGNWDLNTVTTVHFNQRHPENVGISFIHNGKYGGDIHEITAKELIDVVNTISDETHPVNETMTNPSMTAPAMTSSTGVMEGSEILPVDDVENVEVDDEVDDEIDGDDVSVEQIVQRLIDLSAEKMGETLDVDVLGVVFAPEAEEPADDLGDLEDMGNNTELPATTGDQTLPPTVA